MSAILRPNGDHMERHLRHLFDGLPEDCQSGEIEIAYTAPDERGPKHARHFQVKDIGSAVAFAAKKNAQEGCNIYVGGGLRKPGRPNKRSGTEDVLVLTALFADLDDKLAVENAEQNYRRCPPTAIVLTASKPHLRQQFWWRFVQPFYDLEEVGSSLGIIGKAIGGDPAIKDAARVMRLGGSVAYPKKPGRVVELTVFTLCGEALDV